jgi:hypothetical protein
VDKQWATFGASQAAGSEPEQDRMELRRVGAGTGVWDPGRNLATRATRRSMRKVRPMIAR